jgi:glycosyltransferase involved in cell wall biosynthesis
MREFSLIVSTLGERTDDLRALLLSLVPQSSSVKEVIVVDQHADPQHLVPVLAEFEGKLPVLHTRSERGLSRARNHGLSIASGDLVAFPDDDCLYPDGLLSYIATWFATNKKYNILAVGADDAEGFQSGNRWPQDACDIRPFNAFRTTFSPTLFLRGDAARSERFDIRLGVGSGTRYGSGEETDYVLRIIRKGSIGRFDRTRKVIHPRRDMLTGCPSAARAESYGFGMGYLIREHASSGLLLGFLAYDLSRAGLAFVRGRMQGSSFCVAHAKGLWNGYRTPIQEAA